MMKSIHSVNILRDLVTEYAAGQSPKQPTPISSRHCQQQQQHKFQKDVSSVSKSTNNSNANKVSASNNIPSYAFIHLTDMRVYLAYHR